MSLIRETQDRNDPRKDIEIDVPKIGTTERPSGFDPAPDPLDQPSILPEAPSAPVTPYDVPATVTDEQVSEAARSLTQYQRQQQQDFVDETRYNPPNIFDIDVSHYESLADAKLKGGVQPTYYEQENTRVKANIDLNGPRLEFDEDLRFTESAILSGNFDLYKPKIPTAGITRMQDRSFGTVPNLDGIQPMGGRITLPGFVNNILSNPNVGGTQGGAQIFETYINELFTDLEQRFNVSQGVFGMDTSKIDNRAWGYREFPDGTVFNPLGNLPLLKHAILNNPKAFLYSLPPTAKNPLGVFGTLTMGSEWGDYPDGFIGALMYAFDFSRYFVAAGMDVYTTAQGESTGRWEDSKTMQALWGRDFSIASAQRVNPETGEVENPLSLWAQQKAEPKTWREWSERNWLAKNIIVPIDNAKKLITGRSGLDDELSVPADLIGLQEFATGLIFDGFISAGATKAVEEMSILQKNAKIAKAGVTPDDSLSTLQIKSQAKEKAINKLRRKKFDRGTLDVADQTKLDELIEQQQIILGYEKQFETFGEIRVTNGTEAEFLKAVDETEQLLQEIAKQEEMFKGALPSDEAGNITIGSTIQRGQANLDAKADYAFGAPKAETGPATVVELQPVRPKVQTATDYQYKAGQFETMETLPNGEKAARVPSVYDETSGTVRAQSAVDDSPTVPDAPVTRGQDIGTQRARNLQTTQQDLAKDPTNPDVQQAARQARLDYDEYVFAESPEAFQILEDTAQRTLSDANERVYSLYGQIARAETLPNLPADELQALRTGLDEAIASRQAAVDHVSDLGNIKLGANRPRTILENLQDEAHELRILRGTNPGDDVVLSNLLEVERTLDEQMFSQFPESFQARNLAARARVVGLRQRAAANQRRLQELQTNPAAAADDIQQRIALDEYYQREIEYAQIRADDLRLTGPAGQLPPQPRPGDLTLPRVEPEEVATAQARVDDIQQRIQARAEAAADTTEIDLTVQGAGEAGEAVKGLGGGIKAAMNDLIQREAVTDTGFRLGNREAEAMFTNLDDTVEELSELLPDGWDIRWRQTGEYSIKARTDGVRAIELHPTHVERLRARNVDLPEEIITGRQLETLDEQLGKAQQELADLRAQDVPAPKAEPQLPPPPTAEDVAIATQRSNLENIRDEIQVRIDEANQNITRAQQNIADAEAARLDVVGEEGTEQALDALVRESQDQIELNQQLIQRQQERLSEVNRLLEEPQPPRIGELPGRETGLQFIDNEIAKAKQEFINATTRDQKVTAANKVNELNQQREVAASKLNDLRNRATTREGYPKNISIPEAPGDIRFPDSSFNSTPPPKQQYLPHISKNGKVVNRSPMSEWNKDLPKAGKQMVRVNEIATHPDLIPLGKLDDISTENLGLLLQRIANQNADYLAIYKQEVVQINKLAEQYPVGMTQAKSQTMAGGVPEQVSINVPNSKLNNFEKANGVPLASVKPVVEETYYFGTRLVNTTDAFADPATVAGRSPLGTVHTLTQDAFYAEDIAKAPVQNVPNSTSRAYNAQTTTVLEVQVNADRVLNGSAKLPNAFKNELSIGLADINSPQLKTIVGSNGGIEELAIGFTNAIDKATTYKDLISRIDDVLEDWSKTRGFTEFDEVASLQAQRAVTRALQASGIQAVEVTSKIGDKVTKQLGVIDPSIIRATNAQQMDTGSVLNQVARQANAEVWQNRFYNGKGVKSKFAKANAEKSKMQLAAQRVHETEKKLQQSHKNHADLSTEMAKRENISDAEKLQRVLERDAAIDKVFQGKNDKVIQTDLSRSLPETFKRAPKKGSQYLNDDYGEILNPDKSLRETKDLTEAWKTIPDSVNGVKASPDIKARMQRLRQQKRVAMSKQHAREASEAMQEQAIRTEVETARKMYMSDKVNLRDNSLNPVQQWLAARFDMQWKMLQPLKRSGAGLVRKHLGLTAKIGNGLIETQVRMMMVNEAIRHNKLVKRILGKKGAGLTGKQFRQANLDIIELGAHHKLNGGHELLPAGLNVQKQRFDFLVDQLKTWGVKDDDIFDLFESSISMSNKADEVRVVANSLGQNIGSVNQIGYFSRILDRDVAHWLKKLEDEGKPVRNKIVNPTAMDMDITRARNTFHHIPEDLNVMAWLMGITRDELDRIIMNDEFASALAKINVANPGVIDNWVDSGILSKLQYTTNETAELIIKKYGKDLPMFLRGDIFLDNPVRAWNMYGDFLKKQVERSAIYKDLVEDGLDAGWSVPKAVYNDLPDELAPGVAGISKKDFVLWNEGSVRQFLPNYKGADIYVHKAVNNQVQSLVHLFGHPELMNTSSQIVSEISRFYNQSLLLHPFYSINVAVDSTMQFFAAGGDLLRLPQAYWDLSKALRTGNLDHFDNVTKAYWNWDGTKQLTQREFFEEFMLTNSIDITPFDLPGLGNEIGSTGKKWSHLVNPQRGMNWAWNYSRRFGAKDASTQFFRDVANVQGKFFQPLAAAASHAEAASKWALAQTWLDARPGNSIGQFLRDYGGQYPTRKIQSGKEAWDWMQDYYTTWNTAGAGTFGAATGFITPFSTYAYWNTPANIRKFMKNPQQYINYARIWGFLNRDMAIDDKINEYSVPSWLADNMSFAIGKDTQGRWIMFRPRGMFSQGDIASAITLTGKTTARMMGFYPGSSQDQVNQILAEETDTRIFADMIKDLAPIFGKLGALYTGEDLQGRPIANPNQVEGRLTGLDWRTEYVLSLYEPFGRFIRANPFSLMGQPEIVDSRTKVPVKAAVPGKILGGGERIEYDTTKYENPMGLLKVMQFLGAPITVIDTDRNLTWSLSRLGTTYNKVSQVRSTMHKEMVEMIQKGKDKTFPAKFAKLKTRHDDLMMKEIQLAKDFTILKEYFRAHNIVSSEDIRTVETAIYNEWLRQNPNVYKNILDRFRANESEIIDAFESTIKVDTIDIDFGVGGTTESVPEPEPELVPTLGGGL